MRHYIVVLVVLLVYTIGAPPRPAAAREICFPDQPAITACLADPLADYWEANGGLPVFGYPLRAAQMERQSDLGTELLTQWTERARLEVHPENQPPYTILMGRLGAERLAQLGRDPAQEGREAGPIEGCLWFEETGHNVCDQAPGLGFNTYWSTHGLRIAGLSDYARSLQLFGLPLTAAQLETNSSGVTVLTQWFERARFEWHPDQPDEYKVLLGLLGREAAGGADVLPVFGVQIDGSLIGATVTKASEAGATWVRSDAIRWSAVEPSPGARDWASLASVEANLQALAAHQLTTILAVHGTPAWAQQIPGVGCGPMKPEALDAFAAFMHDLVARYSQPPYNVHYWEIWNEPDVDPSLISGNSPYGCWGDASDPYYGGGAFAEMLKRVYPAIKQANPSVQVIFGGLLLDCDPAHPPAGKDCGSAHFLEGVLRNGGGAAFDVLAYHGYAYWRPGAHDWDLNLGNWAASGGAVLGKLAFLREVMARYGTTKRVMLNEAGLICTLKCPHKDYDPDQANYIVRLYTRAKSHALFGVIWFTLDGPGWREGGLLDAAQQPRLGYQALQSFAARLGGAEYAGTFSNGALEGYSFRKGAIIYRVCWTNDGSTVTIPLPAATSAVYDKLGQPHAFAAPGLEVGHEPIIIESQA
jgi:Cellulase (glycosyl hydrolase family 5)